MNTAFRPLLRGRGHRSAISLPNLPMVLAVLLATGALMTSAQQTNAPSSHDYTAFRIIPERNIFNPYRTARLIRSGNGRREERRSSVNSFSFVGTMAYGKGTFAFFDGSNSDLKQVLEVKGAIAGYTVAEITPNSVKLEKDGKPIEMKIGSQMQREENGPWQLVEVILPSKEETASTSADAVPTDSSLESNDVLKKLMQRKEQEEK